MARITKAIWLLPLLASCTVGPDYQRPEFYSDEQISTSLKLKNDTTLVPIKDWYKSFEDDELNQLIDSAYANSPDIASAKEKLIQARINLNIVRGKFVPDIDFEGSYVKSDNFETQNYKNKSTYYKTGFDASWELDIWGGNRRLAESSKAGVMAAAANFDNIKVTLAAEIAADYINYRQSQKMLQITEQNLKLQQDILDIIKQKYSAGLADDLALEQAKSSVLTTSMQIPNIRAKANSYYNAMAILTGKLPHQLQLETSDILDRKPQTNSDALYNLPVSIIKNRPDVKAYEQNLIAQNALIGNKIASMFPSISLSGFLGWQNITLSPIINSDYQIYNLTGGTNLPLWNWNKLLNQVRLQKSKTGEAALEYQKSILNAVSEVNQAVKNLEEEIIRCQSAEDNKKTQGKILELSLKKYKNGLIEFSDVLTAEQNKLKYEQEYIQSLSSWYLDIISFNKAIGGGYAN